MVDDYFTNIVEFLNTGATPSEHDIAQKKQLVVRVTNYQLIAGTLYKLGADGILRRCVLEHETSVILEEAHDGIVGGHYAGKATTQNILCPPRHVCSHRIFFFSPEELQGSSISLSGNLHPQQSFPEVSPLPPGDQLNLAISRVRDLKPPTLPFKSCDTRSGDTGIAPSFTSALTTYNRGLGLMLAPLATSQPRNLAG
jgi:hypothetical protein